ncbi:unnamed protein product [Pieris brassicae]|uniref:Uncharacterized protein n=1 Tax=Pieris brassicae TaxID=7116 RepID=A0A9P0TDV9_PIEBR|nr:unnamed protein product [Pieris brassicae]
MNWTECNRAKATVKKQSHFLSTHTHTLTIEIDRRYRVRRPVTRRTVVRTASVQLEALCLRSAAACNDSQPVESLALCLCVNIKVDVIVFI